MEEDFSNSGLLDIVRGLQGVDVDPDGTSISEEQQGDASIQLSGDNEDVSEYW